MPIVLSTNQPIAKKEHRCNFCGGVISIGEKYHTANCVYDGVCYTWKSHSHCSFIASELRMYDDCYDEGLDSDTFCEYINERYFTLIGESDDGEGKTFAERLKYVCDYYLTNLETKKPKPELK